MALATVTDEFIKYIRGLQQLGEEWALDEASEFLVIAATLLDLKAARLLPAGEVEDDEDIALLEARDLLFARLLQYKAFKQVAGLIGTTLELEARRYPRQVALEEHFAALLPELVWKHTPQQFAALAEAALQAQGSRPHRGGPGPPARQRRSASRNRPSCWACGCGWAGPLTFRALIADAESTLVVVARFLALLEMFRDRAVAFDQLLPLGDLTVRWTAGRQDWSSENLSEEYEEQP